MAWHYRYDARTDAFISYGNGVLNDADIIAGVNKRYEDPSFHQGARHFVDYADVDKFEVTPRFVEALQDDPPQPKPGRRAFLMFSPTGASEYERLMRKLLTENVRVFYKRADAVEWLNEGAASDKCLTLADVLPDETWRNEVG